MKKLSQPELENNKRILANAVAQQRLEGQEVTPETLADLERVAKGEMTTDEAISRAHARHQKNPA